MKSRSCVPHLPGLESFATVAGRGGRLAMPVEAWIRRIGVTSGIIDARRIRGTLSLNWVVQLGILKACNNVCVQ